jgi:hypothetical protein
MDLGGMEAMWEMVDVMLAVSQDDCRELRKYQATAGVLSRDIRDRQRQGEIGTPTHPNGDDVGV